MRNRLRGIDLPFVLGASGAIFAACVGDVPADDQPPPAVVETSPSTPGVVPGVSLPASAARAPNVAAAIPTLRTLWTTARDHRRGTTPRLGTGMPFERSGAFELEGETAAGTARLDGAVVWDPESSDFPATMGGGAFDVTIGGVAFARSDLQSFAAVLPDDSTGTPFVLLAGMSMETDPARGDIGHVVYVLFPAADFVPGTDVALDGETHVVIYASGPIEAEEPEIAGAAMTGRISIVSGGLAIGDAISATVTGDFGAIAWDSVGPEGPPEGPPPEATGFTPGEYAIAFAGPAAVHCEDAYAGRESEFAAITATDLGLSDGVVEITSSFPGTFEVGGAPLSGAFGSDALPLDYSPIDSTLAMWVGFVEAPGAGPSGIPRLGTYIALADPSFTSGLSIEGEAGAFYGDERSGCSVAFGASLSPR